MSGDVIATADEKMKKAITNLQHELQTVRTGRANPALLDRVEVDYYGSPTALKGVANISSPDGRSLLIQPYEKTMLKEIEKAINTAQLGLTPTSDGSVVRISIPTLTEERRKEMVKIVKKYGEECRVAVRNVRRDASDQIKKSKAEGISEDEIKRKEETLQKTTDKRIKEVDKVVQDKEAEVMDI
ncbi:MAG TPA: ribosome recycling factor [Drouetiella sp.]